LERRGNYLAFSDLQELHQYLTENSGHVTVIQGEEEKEALALQSIKV
jgi:hypothetical protein